MTMVNNLNTGEPQTLACGGISSLRNDKDGGNDHKDTTERRGQSLSCSSLTIIH